jgi:hypothetical protein
MHNSIQSATRKIPIVLCILFVCDTPLGQNCQVFRAGGCSDVVFWALILCSRPVVGIATTTSEEYSRSHRRVRQTRVTMRIVILLSWIRPFLFTDPFNFDQVLTTLSPRGSYWPPVQPPRSDLMLTLPVSTLTMEIPWSSETSVFKYKAASCEDTNDKSVLIKLYRLQCLVTTICWTRE